MNLATDLSRAELLEKLRTQAAAPTGDRVRQRFPVPGPLAELMPGGGLKSGSAYCLDAAGALLLALLAEPSQAGHWCAAVGCADFGSEAAELAGINLSRLALVPNPGEQWLAVVAALAEVVPVLAVRPPTRVREADASRLAARMRDRGATLLVVGDWPRAEARLAVSEPKWQGLGAGYGCLTAREVRVSVAARGLPGRRSVQLLLPAPDGQWGEPNGLASARPGVPRLRVAG